MKFQQISLCCTKALNDSDIAAMPSQKTKDLRVGNFRSNRISNLIGGYDSNSNRIESGGSRLHVQLRLSCGSCVCALATAVQLYVKWSCKHISQLQTAQRLMFLLNSE